MSAITKKTKKTSIRVDKHGYDRLRAENARLRSECRQCSHLLEDTDEELPPLPPVDESGQYPAIETARAIIARQVIRGRKAVGWTQAELAACAGIRQETVSRIETGKHSPGLKTMAKIDRALSNAGV